MSDPIYIYGPGGLPLALRLSEGLGRTLASRTCVLLDELLLSERWRLIRERVVLRLLVDVDLTGKLKVVLIEGARRHEVLTGGQQLVVEVRTADFAECTLRPIGRGKSGNGCLTYEVNVWSAVDGKHGAAAPSTAGAAVARVGLHRVGGGEADCSADAVTVHLGNSKVRGMVGVCVRPNVMYAAKPAN